MPNIGYGSNKKTKHMLGNGFLKFVVHNVGDLNLLLMHNRCVWELRGSQRVPLRDLTARACAANTARRWRTTCPRRSARRSWSVPRRCGPLRALRWQARSRPDARSRPCLTAERQAHQRQRAPAVSGAVSCTAQLTRAGLRAQVLRRPRVNTRGCALSMRPRSIGLLRHALRLGQLRQLLEQLLQLHLRSCQNLVAL